MRYYIIFGITFILALLIVFYNPNEKYLGIYKDSVNINLENYDDEYKWIYEKDDSINIVQKDDFTWKLNFLKEGKSKITYYYTNDETKENAKYIIYYVFDKNKNHIYWLSGEAKGLLDFPNPY